MTNYVRLCYVAGHENRMLLEELLEYLISTCTNFDNYHIYRFFKDGDAALILECIELNSFDKLHLHLLYYLIRELNLIQPPSRGWGATSHHGSLTIGDGVQLIYQKYNLIFHSGQTQFTDEEVREIFSIFKDIARIFERFFYHRCDEEIVSRYTIIETCCVDHEMRSKYREHLHLLEMNLKNTSGKYVQCKPFVEKCDNILKYQIKGRL